VTAITPTSALTSTPLASSSTPTSTIPSASLIGLRYMRNVYDRRLVNLRTASQQGIRVDANSQLQISDLVVSTSKIDPKYSVQIEAYADNEYIGHATSKPMIDTRIQWDTIEPEKYIDGDNPTTTWIVQPGWQSLRLAVVIYLEGRPINEIWTTIKLVRQASVGTSWMYDLPYVKLASLVYQVNDGPQVVLDMRKAIGLGEGIRVKAGDQLTLREVWYNATNPAGSDNHQTMQFEALLLKDEGFDDSYFRHSPDETIQAGTHKFSSFIPMTWTVAADRKFLEVKFLRDDQAIIDPLQIPLNPNGSTGLVSLTPKVELEGVTYSVNGGPERILDIRNYREKGIAVKPGDKLRILEVWYRADRSSLGSQTINIEAYPTINGNWLPDLGKTTAPIPFEAGRHSINNPQTSGNQPLEWTIDQATNGFSLRLIQNSMDVVDYLSIKLSPTGGSDLSPMSQ
jgi:hypothetical protein